MRRERTVADEATRWQWWRFCARRRFALGRNVQVVAYVIFVVCVKYSAAKMHGLCVDTGPVAVKMDCEATAPAYLFTSYGREKLRAVLSGRIYLQNNRRKAAF